MVASDAQITSLVLHFCVRLGNMFPEQKEKIDSTATSYVQLATRTHTESLLVGRMRATLAPFAQRMKDCDTKLVNEIPPIAGVSIREMWHSESTSKENKVLITAYISKLAKLMF